MKKILMYTALIGGFIFSQSARAGAGDSTIVLTGVGRDGCSAVLKNKGDVGLKQAEAPITSGRFSMRARIKKPGFFLFSTTDPVLKEFDLFLSPGDQIAMAVEGERVVMSGKGSGLNQFLYDMSRQYDYRSSQASEVYRNRVRAITAATDPEVIHKKALLLGYTQGEYLDVVFGPSIDAKAFNPADEIREVAFSDWDLQLVPELVLYPNWRQTLTELMFARMQAGKLSVHSKRTWVADFGKTIDNAILREAYIVALLEHAVSQGDFVSINEVIKKALPLVKTPANRTKIDRLKGKIATWGKLYKNVQPGTDMTGFSFIRPDGSEAVLSDYKGRYVFVDIWSTYCKPCIAEMPYLKKLESDLHGKDIFFLSLSVDSEPAVWKAFLKKRNLSGEQLITRDGNNDPFCRKIGLAGIPRLLILDKAGKVVDYNCASRPSNPLLKLYLEELLRK